MQVPPALIMPPDHWGYLCVIEQPVMYINFDTPEGALGLDTVDRLQKEAIARLRTVLGYQ